MSTREKEKCLDVLGLPHNSSEDDIKKAYRRLAKQYHPDKNTDDGAKEQFQEISYAYKYLIEGPSAVGAEDEEEGIPLDILLRLFPWMFGGAHYHHPFYHAPFHAFHNPFFHGMYEDSSDEDDYDYYGGDVNGFNFQPSSTYTPGPSKEEKKKEKKKKARERRKAAKMSKAQSSSAPSAESKQATQPSSEKVVKEDVGGKSQQNTKSNNNKTISRDDKEEVSRQKGKTSEDLNVADRSPTPTSSQDNQQTPTKKSKKKLQQEQKKREREMEQIAAEFKQKQKEQAEREAKKEEMKKEKEKIEEIRREELRKKELEEITRQEEKKKEELSGREKTQKRDESIGDADSLCGLDSESGRTVSISDGEGGRFKIVDDVSDVDDGLCVNGDDEDKLKATDTSQRYSAANGFGSDSNGESFNSTQCVRPKVPHASRCDGHQQRQERTCKTQYKDTRSSSRGSERSSTPSQADRQTYTSKKMKRNGRKKQAEADDWSGDESNAPFDSLMPQSEAEEMRMFHEAIVMSEREARQYGVIPETEEEERRMLEAALRESQMSTQWSTLDSLDDVSDCEDRADFGVDPVAAGGASLGDWHQSIGCNASSHNKENVTPAVGLADPSIKLGGLQTTSHGYRSSVPQDLKFDKAVGGKVKGKGKSKGKKETSDSWEFGGGGKKPLQTANAQGLQFGLDDFGCVSDEDDSQIPAWAREAPTPSQQSSENMYYASVGAAGSKQKAWNQSGENQSQWSSTSSRNITAPENSRQAKSSKSSPAPAPGHASSSIGSLGASQVDMDDIDDVDTFDDSSVPSFNSSAEPSSSFDLHIPAAFSNTRMKSFYQRRT